jgi:2-hydroxy-5-methyl-1-naphthoate 7-hydroxylase
MVKSSGWPIVSNGAAERFTQAVRIPAELARRSRTRCSSPVAAAAPGEDPTSDLIAQRREDGSGLTEQELLDTLLLVISAGHETTVNLLDQATYTLLTHLTSWQNSRPVMSPGSREPRPGLARRDRRGVRCRSQPTRPRRVRLRHSPVPGAPLARLEAAIGLPLLFERFPDMRLARRPDNLEHTASFISNGHTQLPCLLTPTSASALASS